jgi:hypothetical protein
MGMGAVDPTTPQTWNRYAYVTNNPLSFTDPTGRNLKGPSGGCNSDVMNCYGGGGTGDSGSSIFSGFCDASSGCSGGFGEGSFCPGGGLSCMPWNFSPGYNMSSTSGAAGLLAAEAAWVALVDQTIANAWQYRLLAKSDCSTDPQDREIKYQLVNLNGTAQSNYYVVQHESNPDRAAGSDFGKQTTYDENGAFKDGLIAPTALFGSSNSIQTFFMSSMNKPRSAENMTSVLVRDSGGNDYSALGAWMSSKQILVNGKLAPSMAPCK